MRTLVCTACGRFTSRYCERCPFCKQKNLVVLDSYNTDAMQHNRLALQNGRGTSSPLSSMLLVAALAGGMSAFLYIWIHPSDTAGKKPAESKLVSSTPEEPAALLTNLQSVHMVPIPVGAGSDLTRMG